MNKNYKIGSFVTIDDDPKKITRKIVEIAQKTGDDHTQQLVVEHKDENGDFVRRVTTVNKITIKTSRCIG